MASNLRAVVLLLVMCSGALVSGCAPKPIMTRPTAGDPTTYAIFFDGTANQYESETNVSKLRHRVAWGPHDRVGTFYVEGVGTRNRVVGMATGYGFGYRIRLAYRYLLGNYRKGDRIYVFGFSRGAYAARILASLLQYGGLPDKPLAKGAFADKVAWDVYGAYKGDMGHHEREREIDKAISGLGLDPAAFEPRKIKVMGLWDTVSSLGWPDGSEEDFWDPSKLYADQLCNVERAYHAMALDDNRALEFTPVLLTRKHLVENCLRFAGEDRTPNRDEVSAMLDKIVEEVWFTGAHSDVGGGYRVGRLDGLSMNWMLDHLKREAGLLGSTSPIRAHHLDCAHDAQKFMGGLVYETEPRSLERYASESPYNDGKLKLHASVLSRLQALPVRSEYRLDYWKSRSPVGLEKLFPECFPNGGSGDWRIDLGAEGCRLERAEGATASSAPPVASTQTHLTCEALKEELY